MNLEIAISLKKCRARAKAHINTCYHPGCNERSINSHIFQKNGILSNISQNRHVWQREFNPHNDPAYSFKKVGINKAFSFSCFCENHDRELFRDIETKDVNFFDYRSCLLFNIRTLYNEIWRKQISIKTNKCILKENPSIFDNSSFLGFIRQEELGLLDLRWTESELWNDLINNKESYYFEHQYISNIDICLSGYFNYDTSQEMLEHLTATGEDLPRVSGIFINIFPYNGRTILLMGYNKQDTLEVKGYFNTYFKENEKRLHRRLTNLILFHCETWACSERFYLQKLHGISDYISHSLGVSAMNNMERKNFPLNIFKDSFSNDFMDWYHRQSFHTF